MNRRRFLLGVGACAPALIAASNLMKIKVLTAEVSIKRVWTRHDVKIWQYAQNYSFDKPVFVSSPANADILANRVFSEAWFERVDVPTKFPDIYQSIADEWNKHGIERKIIREQRETISDAYASKDSQDC